MTTLPTIKGKTQFQVQRETLEFATPKWFSIETAPEEGRFLVYMPSDTHQPIQAAVWHPNIKYIGNHFLFDMERPTHWMPLPAAPTHEETNHG